MMALWKALPNLYSSEWFSKQVSHTEARYMQLECCPYNFAENFTQYISLCFKLVGVFRLYKNCRALELWPILSSSILLNMAHLLSGMQAHALERRECGLNAKCIGNCSRV